MAPPLYVCLLPSSLIFVLAHSAETSQPQAPFTKCLLQALNMSAESTLCRIDCCIGQLTHGFLIVREKGLSVHGTFFLLLEVTTFNKSHPLPLMCPVSMILSLGLFVFHGSCAHPSLVTLISYQSVILMASENTHCSPRACSE